MIAADQMARLERYLEAAMAAPGARIAGAQRIHGGASRETYSIDLETPAGVRGLIVRRDPPASLIDTERALEFAAYRTFHGVIPAPEAIALETSNDVLGAPFFVMTRIDGGAAASPFQKNAYGVHGEALGRAFFAILGRIARVDPQGTPLAGQVDTPPADACWRRELDHWAGVIAADALEPQPIAQAAIRRLRANPPAPAQRLSVAHGDYRSGNFLHDGAGQILAILDWEMAHIGDPLEDLAWALDPLWGHFSDKAGGMIAEEEAIAIWEQESGLRADPAALSWWRLFAHLKGLAIWISSAKAFAEGGTLDPVLAFSGWYCATRHEAMIAARLGGAARGAIA